MIKVRSCALYNSRDVAKVTKKKEKSRSLCMCVCVFDGTHTRIEDEGKEEEEVVKQQIYSWTSAARFALPRFFFCAEHEMHKSLLVSCSKTCSGITHKQSCALNLRNTTAVIVAFTREHCSRKSTHIYPRCCHICSPKDPSAVNLFCLSFLFSNISFFFVGYYSYYYLAALVQPLTSSRRECQ